MANLGDVAVLIKREQKLDDMGSKKMRGKYSVRKHQIKQKFPKDNTKHLGSVNTEES